MFKVVDKHIETWENVHSLAEKGSRLEGLLGDILGWQCSLTERRVHLSQVGALRDWLSYASNLRVLRETGLSWFGDLLIGRDID